MPLGDAHLESKLATFRRDKLAAFERPGEPDFNGSFRQ